MTKEQKNDFLGIECVIMAAKYLNIIGDNPVFLDQLDSLNTEIIQKAPEVAEKLENFQNIYEEWFKTIDDTKNSQISETEIKLILRKDKAREALSQACIQYRKDKNLLEI